MTSRQLINLEYIFVCSIPMLHNFLTTPEGLKSWFCDNVIITEDTFAFSWEGEQESAKVFDDVNNSTIEYAWLNRESDEKTIFIIEKSPITRETILRISTFCDDSLAEEEKIYWDNAIEELKHATGG